MYQVRTLQGELAESIAPVLAFIGS